MRNGKLGEMIHSIQHLRKACFAKHRGESRGGDNFTCAVVALAFYIKVEIEEAPDRIVKGNSIGSSIVTRLNRVHLPNTR